MSKDNPDFIQKKTLSDNQKTCYIQRPGNISLSATPVFQGPDEAQSEAQGRGSPANLLLKILRESSIQNNNLRLINISLRAEGWYELPSGSGSVKAIYCLSVRFFP
jgi:hypothetical protein